jgi:hypothetical protein
MKKRYEASPCEAGPNDSQSEGVLGLAARALRRIPANRPLVARSRGGAAGILGQ